MAGRAPMGADVLQTQIDGLTKLMERGFAEMKTTLELMDERLRKIEMGEAEHHPITTTRLNGAWTKLESLSGTVGCQGTDINNLGHKIEVLRGRVEDVEKLVEKYGVLITEFAATNRTLKWLTGVLTAILIAVLIALVTGNATITFH